MADGIVVQDNTSENEVDTTKVDDAEHAFLLAKNLERVQFTPARAKFIVWNHKSSYDIPEDEPTAALTEEQVEKAQQVFHAVAITINVPLPYDASSTDEHKEHIPFDDNKETTDQTREIQVVERSQFIQLLVQFGGLLSKHIVDTQKSLLETTIDKFLARSAMLPSKHTAGTSLHHATNVRQENGEIHFEEQQFLDFLEHFHAPAYHFGQRMRRFAGRGEIDAVADLIIRGCQANTADGEALSSLHYASEFNRPLVIERLAELCPPGNAVASDHPFLVLDCKDKYGWTPLHCAVHHGNVDCVNVLLKIGANVMSTDAVGKTPLHAAAARGKSYIVEPLLAAKAGMLLLYIHLSVSIVGVAVRGVRLFYVR